MLNPLSGGRQLPRGTTRFDPLQPGAHEGEQGRDRESNRRGCLTAGAAIQQRDRVPDAPLAPTLPLILARELASNLATPMFLVDPRGMLVFYNDAAELVLGRPFAELGAVDALEFGSVLQMATLDGAPVRRRFSPAGIAFTDRKPSHQQLLVTGYDGTRHAVEATAYPLIGGRDELHGVVVVFWESKPSDGSS